MGYEYTDKTKNGTNEYRKDGSIKFGSQADGVSYMVWATTKDGDSGGKQKEQFAFVDGNTMLVTPDGSSNKSDLPFLTQDKVSSTESDPYSFGYKIGDGNYYDPVENKSKNFDATVHTHPRDANYPNNGNAPSGEDMIAARLYPSKVGFTIGLGNNTIYRYNIQIQSI